MGDHLVLFMDRLITESTIEAAFQSRNKMIQENILAESENCGISDEKRLEKLCNGDMTMVDCRICHDEDLDSTMETPCSCIDSLKYAHRRCVQRWCNKKGDTTCDICNQEFKPNYTALRLLFGQAPLHFRGNWGISRRDVMEQQFVTLQLANSSLCRRSYDNGYFVSSTSNSFCCRFLVFILTALLILRQTLPLILTGSALHVLPFFTLILRIVRVLLSVYVVFKVVAAWCGGSMPLAREATSESEESSDDV